MAPSKVPRIQPQVIPLDYNSTPVILQEKESPTILHASKTVVSVEVQALAEDLQLREFWLDSTRLTV